MKNREAGKMRNNDMKNRGAGKMHEVHKKECWQNWRGTTRKAS
jgi:hypothetical protein